MQVAERPISRCTAVRRRRKWLVILLAVLLLGVSVAGAYALVTSGSRIAQKDKEIAALQQQLDGEKEKNDALGKENDTLKGKVESLEKENDALKIEISRKDSVFPAAAYEGKKLVALTFDDGPGKYTAELLDFLKEHRVRATFFLLGTNAAKYPSLIQRMDAEGHAIGNHSYTHPNLAKLSAAGVASQIGNCNAAIYTAIGRNASVLRCPGGSSNATVRNVAKSAGLPIIYWSVDTKDWESRDKDKILEVAFGDKGIKDGSIVLVEADMVDATYHCASGK